MKQTLTFSLALLGAAAAQAAPVSDTSTPKWVESGIREQGFGYRPMSIFFTPDLSADVKKAPAALAAPLYGKFTTGPKGAEVNHLIIVDLVENKPKALFVDANGNGDLTDDPACEWTTKETEKPDGTKFATDFSKAMVTLTKDGKLRGEFNFYLNRGDISKTAPAPRSVNYYTNFGVSSQVKVGDKTLASLVCDDRGTTEFTMEGGPRAASLLWVDANGDGKVSRGESAPAGYPFTADGKWWKAVSLTSAGVVQIEETTAPKPAQAASTKLDAGNKAPTFTAKNTAGKEVKFPDDFKGKLVLIDFWATWCGPCVAELPNVIKAYETYHEKGLEVLGISLDKPGMDQALADFTKKKGAPWPQIYEGKSWKSDIATTYEIHSIPHMILIDGDTGVIVANKNIRGPELAAAIEKWFAAKAAPKP